MNQKETGVAINVLELSKRYGHIEALHHVSLDVQRGEIFGLVGANGAGKTTLIKILVGILRPDAGEVRVLDLDPLTKPYALRRQIGYMPQAAALYEDLSARENLRFFAHGLWSAGYGSASQSRTTRAARLDEVLAFVDLAERQNDLVYGFSGGMKQRLSLACALVHRPRLLLLDEPSTGVDPQLRDSLWSHFRTLARDGVTVLLSTHQMDEVLHCDRVAIMRAGRILVCDTPRGLLSRGAARVTIWRNGQPKTQQVDDYPSRLPGLLGLNREVQRIEVAEPTLEEVVLGLIAASETDEHAARSSQ